MTLENKLGITDSLELARVEEKVSKTKALKLFESGLLDTFEVGTYERLSQIHKYLFEDIYDFAGKIRDENITKRKFSFRARYISQSCARKYCKNAAIDL